MKQLLSILLLIGSVGFTTASPITFEMIQGFSSEDSSVISDEPELIVHSKTESELIISVRGYFSNLKNEELFHDGLSRKLFLLDRESKKVVHSYSYALGHIKSFTQVDNYFLVTDVISRGGSGGVELFGNLKVLTIEKGKLNCLFDEQVAYNDDGGVGSAKFDRKVAIALDDSQLLLNISRGANSCEEIPFGKIGSDLYGMFSFVESDCLSSQKNTILVDLQSSSYSESIEMITGHFKEYFQ